LGNSRVGGPLATYDAAQADFELVWQDRAEGEHLPVKFVFYTDYPQIDLNMERHPVVLPQASADQIKSTALAAFKQAFAPYPRIHVGEGHKGTKTATVVGEPPKFIGDSQPCDHLYEHHLLFAGDGAGPIGSSKR
jgi:hypothetical protein